MSDRHSAVEHGTATRYVNGCRCDACRDVYRKIRARRYAGRVEVDGVLIAQGAEHGTWSTYTNHGCRCQACKTAMRGYWRDWERSHGESGWRRGCRCRRCTVAHNRDTRRRRRRRMHEQFPYQRRREMAGYVADGIGPEIAARMVGVTWTQALALKKISPAWARMLDEALMTGRDPDLGHGTMRAYRSGCRCPDCREAKTRDRGRPTGRTKETPASGAVRGTVAVTIP